MNILFVYSTETVAFPKALLTKQEYIQFGISYISSFLKKNGHNTKLAIQSLYFGRKNREIINRYIKAFRPKLICFTAVATQYSLMADLAKRIKRNHPDIYLLVGGVHVSLNPGEILSDSFDAICIGEGEKPTLDLVRQLERGEIPSGIPNLWIRHRREIEKNPTRPFLQDIDELPFPDREMWQEWMVDKQPSKCSVLLGRGCPFQCSYCSNHSIRKIASGAYVRFRSPGNIIEELKEITQRFPTLREIYLEVETICQNKEWAMELCSHLRRFNETTRHPLSFRTNIRLTPKADLETLFAEFKKTNFHLLNIGVESGSERVRSEILRRHYSNKDIIKSAELARKYGLKICFYNIIGIPGETKDDFMETVRINRICQPDSHYTGIFFPYKGTDLYSLCKEKGLLKRRLNTKLERRKSVLDLPGFSDREIQKCYQWFDYYIYDGYKPRKELLNKVTDVTVNSNHWTKYFYNVYLKFRNLRFLNLLIGSTGRYLKNKAVSKSK